MRERPAEPFSEAPVEARVVRDHDDGRPEERRDLGGLDRTAGHHLVGDACEGNDLGGIGRPGSRDRPKGSWTEKMRPSEAKSKSTMTISTISSAAGSRLGVSRSGTTARRSAFRPGRCRRKAAQGA
jgi:hypothetical protein